MDAADIAWRIEPHKRDGSEWVEIREGDVLIVAVVHRSNADRILAGQTALAALKAYQRWTDLDAEACQHRTPEMIDAATDAGDEFERLREAALARVKGA